MGKLPSTILRRPSLAGVGILPSTAPNLSHTLLPSPSRFTPTTPTTTTTTTRPGAGGQVRHATFVPRSRRPYQFTQLVQLSDGSTFTVRTTSPQALYKSAKDSRNHMLWQPSEKSLRNVEVDEAGKLAAFRERYGTAWDLGGAAAPLKPEEVAAADAAAAAATASNKGGEGEAGKTAAAQAQAQAQAPAAAAEDPFDSLVDLISAYATDDQSIKGGLSAKDQARKDKGGKKK
ncbi:hypothetical protein C8A00DRAFT_11614 [Chaetomidium leptoderma]|uniref:Ribosomal protein bL31m N-terminal domain-containing protein n=1 Tax=Chaetomidium leptoderma TaxID=669021 RepID=A0AAN6VVC4_9PEZI|nr:hypothetical protein C8A00DRAFT_11614 [Chaetomidium leptoderma]